MQAIPSLVVVVDSDGLIVDAGYDETRAGVNNAFRSALGWDDGQIVRRSVLDLIDPDDAYVASMMIAGAANGDGDAREGVPLAVPRRRPHRRRLDRDADRRRHRPDCVARPALRASTSPSASDRRPRSAPPAPASSRRQARRAGSSSATSMTAPSSVSSRFPSRSARGVAPRLRPGCGAKGDHRLARGARCGARGAPRARPRDPPGRPHRPGACRGARSARRPHTAPDRDHRLHRSACPRRSRRPRTTSSRRP